MSTPLELDESIHTMPSDESARSGQPTAPVSTARPTERPAASPAQRVSTFVDDDLQRVIAAVSLWCGSGDDAEAAVAEAVGRAWERLDRGRPIDNLAAWVTTVAMNEVRAGHRRRERARRKGPLIAVHRSVPSASEGAAARIDVQRALATLGSRQREVVALHYGLDLPIAEIAKQLGIADGTVKATLHKSRRLLADKLDHTDPNLADPDWSPS